MNEFVIDGVMATSKNMDRERFQHKFIRWLQNQGFVFAGCVGQYMNADDIPDSCLITSEGQTERQDRFVEEIRSTSI